MSNNIILIKRRTTGAAGAPAALSGGELAFNEVDSTLYYGSDAGVLSIAGSGSFVNRTSNQAISGNKTFVDSTTLGSTTFSSGASINVGSNKLTNLGAPTENADAATKQYVDTGLSAATTAVTNLSVEAYNKFVEKVESESVTLNNGLTVANGINVDSLNTTGNASVGGDMTVTGNLNVLGSTTTIETTTTITSAFSVTNTGSGPALTVTQTGNNDIATFLDDTNTALIIKDGGNVGIGVATPSQKLTVSGNLSASGHVYGTNGDFLGTLDADGAASFGSTVSVTGAATLNSTLAVTGAVTLSNNLSGNGTTSRVSGFVIDGGSF